MALKKVMILDVPLFAGNISEACDIVVTQCINKTARNYCMSATGAHGIVTARKDGYFRSILQKFYLNLPDGMPGVWVGRMKGQKQMERCYGPDFFRALMVRSAAEPITHFFCGGNPGVAENLIEEVSKKLGNDKVVGTYCPPYLPVDKYDYEAIASQINHTGSDIVWIGLSTPKQEMFAEQLARHARVSFIIAVGAAFDFHTDRVRQAPGILQRAGLEWLFRLFMEPRRLFKRYFEIVPLFIYYNLKEALTTPFKSRKGKP